MWLFWGARYILQQFQKTQFIVRVFEKVTLPRHYKCKFKTKNKDQQFHYSLCYAKQRRLGFSDNSFSAYCSPSVLYTKSQLRIYVHENDWKWKLWKIRKEETLKYRVIMGQKTLKQVSLFIKTYFGAFIRRFKWPETKWYTLKNKFSG